MNNKLVAMTVLLALNTAACSDPAKPTQSTQSSQSTLAQSDSLESSISSDISASLTQDKLNQFAATLGVTYRMITNYPDMCATTGADERCFKAQIEFTPEVDFQAQDWAIYYSQMRPVKQVLSPEFAMSHVKGDLYKITPTDKFDGFKKGERLTLAFVGQLWQLSEIDAMPNYYIVAGSLKPAVIQSTVPGIDPETGMETRPYVASYTDADTQYKRSETDELQWSTPEVLFQINQGVKDDAALAVNTIIPTPKVQLLDAENRQVSLQQGIKLVLNDLDRSSIDAALQRLARLGIAETQQGISVEFNALTKTLQPEGYQLSIAPEKIVIHAADDAGFSYALASLASLVDVNHLSVNAMQVEDEPRYGFRGMHLDVARNFHSKQQVLDLLDQMAAYKLNTLHLHLGDDEGWRLQIDGLPELTEVGAYRCHDLAEDKCLLPQLGSGPAADSKVNGFYTKADYIEILAYASARQIQVIPSMDMPGHSRAAIRSMEARYRKLMAKGDEAAANEYRLIDPLDTTQYSSIQYYDDNTLNVCLESTYHFVDKVVGEIAKLHQQAGQALETYHIGADETAGAWLESPVCKAFLADNDKGVKSEKEFGAYFIERVANSLAQKGIKPAGWSDGMSHTRPEIMPKQSQTNIWDVVAHGGYQRAHKQANLGWDTVLSNPEVLYFDFPYSADPKEHGYYWASRSSSERHLYSFMPDNLPANAEQWTTIEGRPFEADDRPKLDEQGRQQSGPLAKEIQFSGIQGQLWSETIRSDELVEYMIFPRLLILAERAWHKADWEVPYQAEGALYNQESGYFTQEMRAKQAEQWQTFANTLGHKELLKLDKANIAYRVPTVGAHLHQGTLYTNLTYPGLQIEYRLDGGQWKLYQGLVKVEGKVEVRAIAADGVRKGRVLAVN
ncbi:carbohydate-binding domain-containing protein [Shewanella sp. AS1]|uniref:family 20 glycosylhydrolase n=1 Tax=Shewanella sp. AS1 TaxID=2907626 RepID=UPI001F2FF188|nr:family 20 glycosylhydrolase [Shewanella sp. AS1]MCE9678025.1 carbohydate-binding domain-containing protein [Shewanella sp. AS1]